MHAQGSEVEPNSIYKCQDAASHADSMKGRRYVRYLLSKIDEIDMLNEN